MRDLVTMRLLAGYRTQLAAAKEIGVGRNTVARWESGARAPNADMITRLAQLYGVDEGDIVRAITARRRGRETA